MKGTVGAGVGVLTGIEATRSGLTAVSMMTETETGTIIVTVIAGDARPQVLDGGGEGVPVEVEVLFEGGITVRSGMAVRRDEPELNSGTGRGRRKNLQVRLMQKNPIMAIMLAHIMRTSSKSSNSNLLRTDIDLSMLLVCVYSLEFAYSCSSRQQFWFWHRPPTEQV